MSRMHRTSELGHKAGQAIAFVLSSPTPSLCPVSARGTGTPDAIEAMRQRNIKHLDMLELEWLNAYGPKPIIDIASAPEGWHGHRSVPVAMAISRGAGPGGLSIVAWDLVILCVLCSRRRLNRRACRTCYGEGHVDGSYGEIDTDADANILRIEFFTPL